MRLIDADELLKASRIGKILYFNDTTTDGYTDVLLAVEVERAPTIEAEPVKYGNWQLMNDTYDRWKDYTCSKCHCCVSRKYNYCPNCGAKMEGGTDNG